MFIIGLAVGALGIKLATVGGTWFFALMGLVMIVAAALIARHRRSGIALYALAFIIALIWSVSDAGWDFWPLFSRLFTFGVLALLCAIVWPFLSVTPPVKKDRHLASRLSLPWYYWQVWGECSKPIPW